MPVFLNIKTDLRQGDPADEILKVARFHHANLIIMGTHARGRFSHSVMGSVARAVTQKAACPVLTVTYPKADSSADSASQADRASATEN